jgi:hypothetical protein
VVESIPTTLLVAQAQTTCPLLPYLNKRIQIRISHATIQIYTDYDEFTHGDFGSLVMGDFVGEYDGSPVGDNVGFNVGFSVGDNDGETVGNAVGSRDDGNKVGAVVGISVGIMVGVIVGISVIMDSNGAIVGLDGLSSGEPVGKNVGCPVSTLGSSVF